MGDCLSQEADYLFAPAHRMRKVTNYNSPATPRFANWDDDVQRFRETNVDASPLYSEKKMRFGEYVLSFFTTCFRRQPKRKPTFHKRDSILLPPSVSDDDNLRGFSRGCFGYKSDDDVQRFRESNVKASPL